MANDISKMTMEELYEYKEKMSEAVIIKTKIGQYSAAGYFNKRKVITEDEIKLRKKALGA